MQSVSVSLYQNPNECGDGFYLECELKQLKKWLCRGAKEVKQDLNCKVINSRKGEKTESELCLRKVL